MSAQPKPTEKGERFWMRVTPTQKQAYNEASGGNISGWAKKHLDEIAMANSRRSAGGFGKSKLVGG